MIAMNLKALSENCCKTIYQGMEFRNLPVIKDQAVETMRIEDAETRFHFVSREGICGHRAGGQIAF